MKSKKFIVALLAAVMLLSMASIASASYVYDSYFKTGQGTLTVTGDYQRLGYPTPPHHEYFNRIILSKWNGSSYVTVQEIPGGITDVGSFTLTFSGLSQGSYRVLIPNVQPNMYSDIQLSFN